MTVKTLFNDDYDDWLEMFRLALVGALNEIDGETEWRVTTHREKLIFLLIANWGGDKMDYIQSSSMSVLDWTDDEKFFSIAVGVEEIKELAKGIVSRRAWREKTKKERLEKQ